MDNAVAIVGIDCKFPGANNIHEYWELLKNGECPIKDSVDTSEDGDFVSKSFLLSGIDEFDAEFFNISKRDAKLMDPQQRLFLESAWKAVEDAGYNIDKITDRVGVFAGSGISTYLICNIIPELLRNGEDVNKILAQIIHGNSTDYLSNRVSYQMNFSGPSLTVQTACSSALTAVHLACRSLLMYECDMAVSGGVAVNANQGHGYRYVKGEIYSRTGCCSPFSDEADGTIFSGGVGTLVLKRYEDAIESGDYIYAVIRGSAINNDGADKMSYSAPSENGQFQSIVDALSFAELEPSDVSYVEAHGTGTDIGDQIEIAALKNVFDGIDHTVKIGSVKSNIGHAIAAAGIAGLIKAVLCVNRGYICPTIHCEKENEKLNLSESALRIAKRFEKWESADGSPRRAGVSSFGMGGSNAHLILESYANACVEPKEDSATLKILRISAKTEHSLSAMKKQLHDYLLKNDVDDNVLTYVYNHARKDFPCRSMLFYFTREELLQKLSHSREKEAEFDNPAQFSTLKNLEMLAKPAAECGASDLSAYQLCKELKQRWERGFEFALPELQQNETIRKQPLPGYVFDHSIFWIDASQNVLNSNVSETANGAQDSDTEAFLKKLWKEYLDVDEEDLDKEFYQVGGNSLVAYQMIADITDRFGIELDISDMIEGSTLQDMNRQILSMM